jgi:L-ascorbate oxidase
MINGQVQPKIVMKDKTVYRWRLVDAGFQDTVKLRIKQITNPDNLEKLLNGTATIESVCDGIDIWQYEVASDGLTHDKTIAKTTNYLQPGYRSDILFALPAKGNYCVYDDKAASGLTNDQAKSARLLAVIEAGTARSHKAHSADSDPAKMAERQHQAQTRFMTAQLVSAARAQPSSVRAQVIADLLHGLKLSKFVPHKSFTPEEIAALQKRPKEYATFDIGAATNDPTGKTLFMVQGNPALNQPRSAEFTYQPDRIDHTLILGDSQIWELNSKLANHPFHIHVNPFQIISITKTDLDMPDNPDAAQYQDLVGTWRDTLLVIKGYTLQVATRYERYIGEYVMHCHILEHEDQGMMQNVKVVPPNGTGGPSTGAHGGHSGH